MIMVAVAVVAIASLVSFVIFIMVLIRLFKENGALHGILGIFCGLYPFIWGWMKHRELDLTRKMTIWSICSVILILMQVAAVMIPLIMVQKESLSPGQGNVQMAKVTKTAPETVFIPKSSAKVSEIQADPFDAVVSLWKGGKFSNPQEALALMNGVIEKHPDFAGGFNNRGVAYGNLNRNSEAISDFNRALEIDSTYADAYGNRGNVNYALGKYDAALADYEREISLRPDGAHGYLNRGLAHNKLQKVDLACMDFKKACELGDCDGTRWATNAGICK
jgi:hypothetical protein